MGRVTDSSNAVVPGVKVQAINTSTGVSLNTETNAEGGYRIPYVLAGAYRVVFSREGFQTLVRDNVQVQIANPLALDVALSVGNVAETVTVSEAVAQLDTASASLGQVVTRQQLEQLPFREGNPMELMKMAPGVITNTHLRLMKPGMTGVLSENSVNGTGSRRSDFMLDGIANTAGDRVAYSPPAAAVQELKVQTSTYDASAGYTTGGVVNLVTRNGTNDWHGDAWFFYRDSRFDNKDFFQKLNSQPMPQYTDKRWGGAIGGPILRDKAHFFIATEFNPYLNPFSFQMTTPTELMRNGNFSELNSVGQIYDPLTGRTDPTNAARVVRDPIPGNIIPASRVDPASRKLVELFPKPNVAGVAQNFQHPNPSERHNWKTVTGRVDYNFSSSNRAFFRYSDARWNYRDPDFHLNDMSTGNSTDRTLRLFAVDDIHTFSPTTVLNVRFGYTYQRDIFDLLSSGVNLDNYGLGAFASLSSTPDRQILPNIRIDNMTGYRQPIGEGNSQDNVDRLITVAGTVNHVRGKHTMAFGVETRFYNEFRVNDARARSPQLNYTATWAVGPFNTSGGVAQLHPLAAFMMGHPASGTMAVVPTRTERAPRTGLFMQDDWRVTRKLTVNLGLRWELEAPTIEINNQMVNGIDTTTPLPIDQAARAAYAQNPIPERPASTFNSLGGVLFAGVDGRRDGVWSMKFTNFMPRVGAAYQLTSTTVLRGGYGQYYDALGVLRTDAVQTGFSRDTILQTTADSIVPRSDVLSNPYPSGLLQPEGSALGMMTNVGNAISAPYPESLRTPRADRFSFGIQQQLPWQTVVEATYAANRGYNLAVPRNSNFLPIEYLSTSKTRDDATIAFLNANFPNPYRGLIPTNTTIGGSANTQRRQLLLPFPQYAGLTVNETIGRAWYDALQMRVDKRMGRGLTVNLSYTYAKGIEQTAFRDPSEGAPEKVLAGSDRTHALQVNGMYELPFGRGQRWGSGWNKAMDTAFGGWQTSAMYRTESGFPLGLGNVVLQPGMTFADIALPKNERTWDRQFNTAAFDTRGAAQPASNLRYYSSRIGNVRVNGFDMLDMVLSKRFALTERVGLIVRAEMYNMLDSVNLMNVDNGPTSGSFGRYRSVNGYARQYQFSAKVQF